MLDMLAKMSMQLLSYDLILVFMWYISSGFIGSAEDKGHACPFFEQPKHRLREGEMSEAALRESVTLVFQALFACFSCAKERPDLWNDEEEQQSVRDLSHQSHRLTCFHWKSGVWAPLLT